MLHRPGFYSPKLEVSANERFGLVAHGGLREGAQSGEGCANLLETGALSCNTFYAAAWKRDVIDYTELASKRWVEKLSMDRIAAEMDWGRTAVIRHLGKIRANPGLVEDGQVRLRIHRRKYKFMGS